MLKRRIETSSNKHTVHILKFHFRYEHKGFFAEAGVNRMFLPVISFGSINWSFHSHLLKFRLPYRSFQKMYCAHMEDFIPKPNVVPVRKQTNTGPSGNTYTAENRKVGHDERWKWISECQSCLWLYCLAPEAAVGDVLGASLVAWPIG